MRILENRKFSGRKLAVAKQSGMEYPQRMLFNGQVHQSGC